MDRIGIVGWGSLWWDPRDLKIRSGGLLGSTWRKDGPKLLLEFSRVSRDGRLTLVIDDVHGVECPTLVARSGLSNLNDAINNLKEREGAANDAAIGYVNLRDGRERDPSEGACPGAVAAIKAWGVAEKYDAMIWTGFRSNFQDKKHAPFSIESALIHLKALPPVDRDRAVQYFRKAPPQIDTPLRKAVAKRF